MREAQEDAPRPHTLRALKEVEEVSVQNYLYDPLRGHRLLTSKRL